jgi:hypothetical protein
LAIGDLAQGPTVLARHTDRRQTLFRETRAVEDQDAPALGDDRPQPAPHAVRIPWRMRDEVLKRLVGHRLGDPRQHRLPRFPLAVAEHALHVRPQGHQLRAMTEAHLELLQPSHQPLHARRRRGIDQCVAAYRNRARSTMSSKSITGNSSNEIAALTKSDFRS